MELTLGSETSTHFNQTPGLYPKENNLHQQHGESLKTKKLYRWLLPVVFGALVFKLLVWCGAEGYVSGLRAAAQYNTL
jgi:hypothetical protein